METEEEQRYELHILHMTDVHLLGAERKGREGEHEKEEGGRVREGG